MLQPTSGDGSVSPGTRTSRSASPPRPKAQEPPTSTSNGAVAPTSTNATAASSAPAVIGDGSVPNVTSGSLLRPDSDLPPAPKRPLPTTTDVYGHNPRESIASVTFAPESQLPEVSSPGRRSVQFARSENGDGPPHSRQASWDEDAANKLRSGTSFIAKLKSLAVTSGLQTPKPGVETNPWSTTSSPVAPRARGESIAEGDASDADADADADAEETADEGMAERVAKTKKKRKMQRHRYEDSVASVPNTPGIGHDVESPLGPPRRSFLRRRATLAEGEESRAGLSEGEGREKLARQGHLRRGQTWLSGGRQSIADGETDDQAPGRRRTGHLRSLTALGGGGTSDVDMTPRRPFFTAGERATTFGAAKWQQMKDTFRALRPVKEKPFDYLKSAELLAELRAGAPAVLMLASMIQRDEHGHKRIPVLLEQLNLRIADSTPVDGDEDRHWIFTIALEYGNGPFRMKWSVKRTIRDILNIHFRYKIALNNDKYIYPRISGKQLKQPKFPLSSFPYLRNVRGLEDSDNDDDQSQAPQTQSLYAPSVRADDTAGEFTAGEMTAAELTASDGERRPRPRKKKSKINMLATRRRSTGISDIAEPLDPEQLAQREAANKRRFVLEQRRMLEKYLHEMIRWLMFRADSNRLCRFLELSALGVRLAAEGSYHGKECYLHIQSSKGLDFRRVLTPGRVIARHSRKWFLVRQSYIVCVESPENMNIYDVYLVDPKFRIVSKRSKLKQISDKAKGEPKKEIEIDLTADPDPGKHHTITIHTSERKVRLFASNQAIIRQFEESIAEMLKMTVWNNVNRFGSFAPVRTKVHAQWLVDGRDYMWNVSRAISMAKDVIYIHDWWLSPELYMRRPPAISQKWRLDRLLQRKAKEGVKVFVIVYRNVEAAVPIDSEYTKYSLLNLHPNIFVQRSPHQFKKNQFFFAHHEKLVVVDHDIAFMGGIDLCFGRWDCPQHPVADDKPTGFEESADPLDAEHCQLFPGKDYSNPRVSDFFKLHEPYAEMYDRTDIPRMPWHDVAMQLVGQPARDLTRHFIQRWNYIRRGRNPTRPTPFLLPPPDIKPEDMESLGLAGTCEIQILRSAGNWSLGIGDVEMSIQSAYVKMIEESEHFVYMENQFFVTSTNTLNTPVQNRIGDALVERIKRAHHNGEDWKCFILIPLLPGFQAAITENQGSSVRIILQLQYRSICRGEHSIFGRLRAEGIEPEEYIQFFSLRQWGKIGKSDMLTTEQLYIHAKIIIVDDRVALIGSANINERSMLGDRDSELASIVRDTDMIESSMGGRPYMVGRFAHTLRLRLMREHLGLDVDAILEEERLAELEQQSDFEDDMPYGEDMEGEPIAGGSQDARPVTPRPVSAARSVSYNHDIDVSDLAPCNLTGGKGKEVGRGDDRVVGNNAHEQEVDGYGVDHWKSAERLGIDAGRDSIVVDGREVLVNDIASEGRGTFNSPGSGRRRRLSSPSRAGEHLGKVLPIPPFDRRSTEQLGLPRASQLPTLPIVDDSDIGGPPIYYDSAMHPIPALPNPLTADIKQANIHKDCMKDPLNPSFFADIWNRVAENNAKIYRRVFRCQPDSEVQTFAEYAAWDHYATRFRHSMEGRSRTPSTANHDNSRPGTTSTGMPPSTAPNASVDRGASLRNAASHPKLVVSVSAAGAYPEASNRPGTSPNLNNRGVHTPTFNKVTQSDKESIPSPQKRRPPPDAPSPVLPPADTPFPAFESSTANGLLQAQVSNESKQRRATFTSLEKPDRASMAPSSTSNLGTMGTLRRRRRATTRGSRRDFTGHEEVLPKADAEDLLNMIQGHLVEFPYDWLYSEENKGAWLHGVDSMAPVAI
ncbi:uncharacterized protein MKZ38_001300 [Zalerion maritima]|uniref:Phospholipase D1 n=1 Tax=Zalerion maritima TaxID=339359 RepID=A0AAD5RQD9_9PEZI|nr:uncharacterized protein MKZ38_001300 [Zalerion maritima]